VVSTQPSGIYIKSSNNQGNSTIGTSTSDPNFTIPLGWCSEQDCFPKDLLVASIDHVVCFYRIVQAVNCPRRHCISSAGSL